jgi:hypothetical protein
MATGKLERASEFEEALMVALGSWAHVDKAVYYLVSRALDFLIWVVTLLLKGLNDVNKDKIKSHTSKNHIASASEMELEED